MKANTRHNPCALLVLIIAFALLPTGCTGALSRSTVQKPSSNSAALLLRIQNYSGFDTTVQLARYDPKTGRIYPGFLNQDSVFFHLDAQPGVRSAYVLGRAEPGTYALVQVAHDDKGQFYSVCMAEETVRFDIRAGKTYFLGTLYWRGRAALSSLPDEPPELEGRLAKLLGHGLAAAEIHVRETYATLKSPIIQIAPKPATFRIGKSLLGIARSCTGSVEN